MGNLFDSDVLDVVKSYIHDSRLNAEQKQKLLGWLRSRDLPRLCKATSLISSTEYQDEWQALRQVEAFFKKNASHADPAACTAQAEVNFHRAERICRISNRRLDWFYAHRDRLDPDVSSQMDAMAREISRVLGPFSDFLDAMPKLIRVTSGATQDRSRRRALPFLKISGKVRAPTRAKPLLTLLAQHIVGQSPAKFVPVDSNRIALVPKNWKTHRTVACEGTHAVPLQLAFDSYAKTRLVRYGIDLSDQTRNQDLARKGSVDGSWCTVDGEMASDCVCYNAVAWLFPREWFHYLASIRAGWYEGVFGQGKYAKFSSMGNGATFCIETLLFWAACRAVGSKRPAVYGDDIVIETELFPSLKRLLNFIGFKINVEKSFSEGPFRESCGADWYRGANITPFYCRSNPRTRSDWCHFVNGVSAIAVPGGECWSRLVGIVRSKGLPLGPWSDNSRACVHLPVQHCYDLKLLYRARSRDHKGFQSLAYKGYTVRASKRVNRGWRSYLLWFFHARTPQGERANGKDWWKVATYDEGITSVLSCGDVRSCKSELLYYPPETSCTPPHLWLWADALS